MTRAVCGFLFSPEMDRVVLIRKNRPEWQAGLLNGVGGKVEEDEFAEQAVAREFAEETGMRVDHWRAFCLHRDKSHGYEVVYYAAVGAVESARTTTDEEIVVCAVADVPHLEVIPNLRWLIPMALDPEMKHARTVWADAP